MVAYAIMAQKVEHVPHRRSEEKHSESLNYFESLSLAQKAYVKIRDMMLNSDIVPGQRLILVDLGKKLGMSRTPVQYALHRLEAEGMLDFRPNIGYTVHEVSSQELNDLYDAREAIELAAIKKTIERMTPDGIEDIKAKQKRCEQAILDNVIRGRLPLDQAFHLAYVEIAGNRYLTNGFRELYQHLYLRRIDAFPTERGRQVISEHKDIFGAIIAGDLNGARKHISRHIRAGKLEVFSDVASLA